MVAVLFKLRKYTEDFIKRFSKVSDNFMKLILSGHQHGTKCFTFTIATVLHLHYCCNKIELPIDN